MRHGLTLACAMALTIGATSLPAHAQDGPSVLAQQRIEVGGAVITPGLTYSTLNGFRPLTLDLYRPKTQAGPVPLVLWVHGGGWTGGSPRGDMLGRDGARFFADLAARGYVVASVTYRFSGEARFPAQIQDVKSSIQWLRGHAAEYGIDPARVVLMGGSAGGYLSALGGLSCGDKSLDPPAPAGAAAGAAPPSNCVSAAVAMYPIVDLRSHSVYIPASGVSARSPQRLLGCDVVAACDPARLASSDVLAHADPKDPPFLIFHGDADVTVSPDQSRMLLAALKAKNVPAELIIVPGAVHGFGNVTDAQRTDITQRLYRFIDEHTRR